MKLSLLPPHHVFQQTLHHLVPTLFLFSKNSECKKTMSVHNVRHLCKTYYFRVHDLICILPPWKHSWSNNSHCQMGAVRNTLQTREDTCPSSLVAGRGGGPLEVDSNTHTLPTVPHYLRILIFIWQLPSSLPSEKDPWAQFLDDLPCIWPMVRSLSNLSTPRTKQENL